MRSLIECLVDARDYARRAAGYVKGMMLPAFTADAIRRDAVCFCLSILGEACSEATKQTNKLPADIPWVAIKGMRNVLIHEYWRIDDEIVYNAAQKDAELLASRLDDLINELA